MNRKSRLRYTVGLAALVVALGAAAIAVPAASASTSTREDFKGRVVSTQRQPTRVVLKTRSGRTVRFRVTKNTRFRHIKGFSGLKRGLRVEVKARHASSGWVAIRIERSGSHS